MTLYPINVNLTYEGGYTTFSGLIPPATGEEVADEPVQLVPYLQAVQAIRFETVS